MRVRRSPLEQTAANGWLSQEELPYVALLQRAMEGVPVETAWLAWSNSGRELVVPRQGSPIVNVSAASRMPEPPAEPLLATMTAGPPGWVAWCRERGIQSCAVAAVLDDSQPIGSIGISTGVPEVVFGRNELRQLVLVSWLAAEARKCETRLIDLQSEFERVKRLLDERLPLDGTLHTRSTFRRVARAVAATIDASYCRLLVVDSGKWLALRASDGHRLPSKDPGAMRWRLTSLARCAEAVRQRRSVVVTFGDGDAERERRLLFTDQTRTGFIVPFMRASQVDGLLLVGEERHSLFQHPERLAMLEFVAYRVGNLLRMARLVRREHRTDPRQKLRSAILAERSRLARELHDEVGQALSALLIQVRVAKRHGMANLDNLGVIEMAAQDALDGARAVSYRLRYDEGNVDHLSDAQRYAETILPAAGCQLSWVDERVDKELNAKVAREVAAVVKESIINIVRHANADAVSVRLESADGRIRISVQDNGVGFMREHVVPVRSGRGLGLLGNAERLTRIGGVFNVTSAPGAGTIVVVDARQV